MAKVDGIFVSKNFSIIKHLIEECLRRGNRFKKVEKDPLDVPMGMALLRLFLSQSSHIYVVADSYRMVEDFRDALNMPDKNIKHLWLPDVARGIEGSVVVLHTGARMAEQQKRYDEVMAVVETSNCVIWHVGDWR